MIESVLQLPGGLDLPTNGAAEQLSKQISASEWLGPLAPVALSPFFGIAVLSGLATYGPDFLQKQSGLIGDHSPMNNAYLFWTMATLALLTSLPRFSKVSKPFALAVENVESYASVIILITVKFLSSTHTASTTAQPEVALAGFGTVPLDTLMSIAAAMNVIVINTVKLFFELLVWMIPIPAIDAALEIGQKGVCVGLMGLYCYNPVLATLLNLLLLTICALLLGWIVRKTAYYRHLIISPLLAWLLPNYFAQHSDRFTAYCEHKIGGLPAYTPFTVRQISQTEFEVCGKWLWRSFTHHFNQAAVQRESGILADRLRLRDDQCDLTVSHRPFAASDSTAAIAGLK